MAAHPQGELIGELRCTVVGDKIKLRWTIPDFRNLPGTHPGSVARYRSQPFQHAGESWCLKLIVKSPNAGGYGNASNKYRGVLCSLNTPTAHQTKGKMGWELTYDRNGEAVSTSQHGQEWLPTSNLRYERYGNFPSRPLVRYLLEPYHENGVTIRCSFQKAEPLLPSPGGTAQQLAIIFANINIDDDDGR